MEFIIYPGKEAPSWRTAAEAATVFFAGVFFREKRGFVLFPVISSSSHFPSSSSSLYVMPFPPLPLPTPVFLAPEEEEAEMTRKKSTSKRRRKMADAMPPVLLRNPGRKFDKQEIIKA